MSYLKAYIRGLAVSLLYSALQDLGFSTAVRNAAVTVLYNAFDGIFGDALALAFAPLVWIWRELNSINVSIPSWITDAVNFIIYTLRPNWNWLINSVQGLANFWTNRHYYISQVINSVLGDWNSIFYYVRWLRDNAHNIIQTLLYNGMQWVWERLPGWAQNAIRFVALELNDLVTLVNYPLSLLGQFLHDPSGFIFGLFDATLKAAWVILRGDIHFLIWLFTDGKAFIIALVSDPSGTILALIEKYFLPWLERLIKENW